MRSVSVSLPTAEPARDSPVRRLLVQASHYSLGSILTTVAGLVSYPFLTRIFSLADYGAMSLVAATLTVCVSLGKLGVQHSIVRYHSEIVAGNSRFTLPQLYATSTFGMISSAVVVMGLVVLGAQVAPAHWLGGERLRQLLAIASLLLVVQVVESVFVNALRSEQKTIAVNQYQVIKKYLVLGCLIGALLWIAPTLTVFYGASVFAETVAVTGLVILALRRTDRPRPRLASFSRPLYLEMITFGIPMMIGSELSGNVLAVGDRYVIGGLLGEAPLGLYSAAYNLCQYVQAVFISAVAMAITPIYMRIWEEKGPDETAAFISRSLRTYFLLGVPIVAGLAAVGPTLLRSLAGAKYGSAASVLPWVIAGMVVDGTNPMLGAGLYIQRRTRVIMAVVMGAATLNIGLNLLLVPRIGIVGAAVATLVSYALASLSLAWSARSILRIVLPWGTMARAALAAAVMYAVLVRLPVHLEQHHWLDLGAHVAVGVAIYGAIMAVIDGDARAIVRRVRGAARS